MGHLRTYKTVTEEFWLDQLEEIILKIMWWGLESRGAGVAELQQCNILDLGLCYCMERVQTEGGGEKRNQNSHKKVSFEIPEFLSLFTLRKTIEKLVDTFPAGFICLTLAQPHNSADNFLKDIKKRKSHSYPNKKKKIQLSTTRLNFATTL